MNLKIKIILKFKSIFYFFFPKKCYCCEKTTNNTCLCDSCKKYYNSVFKTSDLSDFIFKVRLVYASIYTSIAKKMILDFKYRKEKNIPDFFLENAEKNLIFQKMILSHKYISYIPTSKKNIQIRSYDQAEVLAEKMSRRYNLKLIKVIEKNEIKINNEKILEQKKLTREERLHNVKGNFKVLGEGKKFKGNLLIVDDVYTTGATAYEVKRILEEVNPNINITFFTLGYTKYF